MYFFFANYLKELLYKTVILSHTLISFKQPYSDDVRYLINY